MPDTALYPRLAELRLTEAMADSPAVLIHGPRQCGKTTLAQVVGKRKGYAYVTFDDAVTREAATADPIGFVADLPRRVIIDEVQHMPQLFATLKMAIDRNREPGRFVLTGSATCCCYPSSPTLSPAAWPRCVYILLRSPRWRARRQISSSGCLVKVSRCKATSAWGPNSQTE